VDTRDAHRAGFGIQARREGAQGVDTTADTVLRLEDDRVVALPGELEGGNQAGHPCADDDHPLAASLGRLQTMAGDREDFRGHWHVGRRWLLFGIGRVTSVDAHGRIVSAQDSAGGPSRYSDHGS
jgi:hypothetical protein